MVGKGLLYWTSSEFKSFATRLAENDKKSIVMIGAVNTKLLHIVSVFRVPDTLQPNQLTKSQAL